MLRSEAYSILGNAMRCGARILVHSTDCAGEQVFTALIHVAWVGVTAQAFGCLLYTSDAADE